MMAKKAFNVSLGTYLRLRSSRLEADAANPKTALRNFVNLC